MLNVQNVHTYYGDSYILQGVTLELKPGQVVALFGRDGVGKTTLVRSIIGYAAKRGKILFKDTDITRMQAHRIAGWALAWCSRTTCLPVANGKEHLQVTARGAGHWDFGKVVDFSKSSQPAAQPGWQTQRRRTTDARSGARFDRKSGAADGRADRGAGPDDGARARRAVEFHSSSRARQFSRRATACLRVAVRRCRLHHEQRPHSSSMQPCRTRRRRGDENAIPWCVGLQPCADCTRQVPGGLFRPGYQNGRE